MSNTRISFKLPTHSRVRKAPSLDPFFEVEVVPLLRADTNEESDLRYLVNKATRKDVGSFTRRYNVTTHQEASETVRGMLDKMNLPYEVYKRETSNEGSRFYEIITFPTLGLNPASDNPSTALDNPGLKVDDILPSIQITNSYDTFSELSWSYRLFRVICKNGMATLEKETKIGYRHSQIPNYEKVQGILQDGLETSHKVIEHVYNRLNSESGLLYLDNFLRSDMTPKFKKTLIDRLGASLKMDLSIIPSEDGKTQEIQIGKIETDMSAWSIYNSITEIASHTLSNAVERNKADKQIARLFQVAS